MILLKETFIKSLFLLVLVLMFSSCAGVKLNKGLTPLEVIDAALDITPACSDFNGIITVGVNNFPNVKVNLKFDNSSAFFVVYGPFNMALFSASYSFENSNIFASSSNPQYKELAISLIKNYINNLPAMLKPRIDRQKPYEMTHSNKGYLLKDTDGNEILISDQFLVLKNYYNGFIYNYTYKPDTSFNEIEIIPTSEDISKHVKKIFIKFETPSCFSTSIGNMLKK